MCHSLDVKKYLRHGVVHLDVEPDDGFDVVLPEVVDVELRCVVAILRRMVHWTRERQEFLRHYPTDVAVLYVVHLLVLVQVEVLEVDDPEVDRLADRGEAVYQPDLELRLSYGRVLEEFG